MAFTGFRPLDFSGLDKALEGFIQKRTLADLGQDIQAGNYDSAAKKAFAMGDANTGINIMKLGQGAKDRLADQDLLKGLMGPQLSASQPAQGGQSLAALGQPNDVENSFIGAVKGAGLTNPVGLGAVAAYGKAESGFAPQNVNRSWNDPSESGQPGQAGGIMSWRAERLQNLQNFARQRGETGNGSPATQALFFAQEDPQIIPRLQAAKTPEEANTILANAWRFAGYNRPGGENARRLALTQQYAGRFGGQAGAPAAPIPVQVAQNEADVQRLEAQQGNPVLPPAEPVQVAEMPAPGASPAQGFAIPGMGTVVPESLATNPRIQNLTRALAVARSDSAKAAIKGQLELEIADAKNRMDTGGPLDREGKRLANEKLRREVEGEGARPMTPQEREAYSVPEGQPAYMNGKGEPKFGPASTKITNSIGATEGEYAKANGKAISERFGKIVEEGDAAQVEAGALAQLRALGGQIKNMGSGAALQAKLAEYGIKVGENVSEIEAYSALIDKLTPQQRIAGAGATSDFDAKMFKSSLPGLIRTPQGNAIILDTLDALNAYKRQRADVVAEAMANNEKPADVLKKLKALPDPFAAFKEAAKSGGAAKPEAAAPAGGIKEGARAQGPNGQIIVLRNGQWVPE